MDLNENMDREKEIILPAIRGTEAVLEAAKSEPRVKRLVYTSSYAAVITASLLVDPPAGTNTLSKPFRLNGADFAEAGGDV